MAQAEDSVLSYADTTELGQLNGLKTLRSLQTLDRDMVETLIHSIQVYSENRIEISWNFNEDSMQLLAAEEDAVMRNGN